ncbi:arginine deiminase [Porphyromonas cangingivalis]|uniref:dimethylarginine dimethylaminohydrolase family protein n=1 Tax=Porphyromonas cangingivalis TaxID=36874 RepID=UPI000D820F8D|nr:amidinotransferase [Porphyromonas cangingivalis]SPY36169.1 arginine deiminase [Porphyromonas cangingivalis]
MIQLNVHDECGTLKTVVVGLGTEPGRRPTLTEAYDAKSYNSLIQNIYPSDDALEREVKGLAEALTAQGIEVLRPESIHDCNQIFARDVAFVIEDKIIRANIISDRAAELQAYDKIFADIDPAKVITPPSHVHIEGGDVLLYFDKIFLGTYLSPNYSQYKMARTNKYAIGFLKDLFPHKEIIPLELVKHDTDPYTGVLHLDCCFQPIGGDKCILFPGGFRHREDWEYLVELFGVENTFIITREEMFQMNPNVFSLSPTKVVIDSTFNRLKGWLNARGIETVEVAYREVSKLGGLLRCTTLPLRREYK